ncbi:MAG: hypothetical protein LBC53_08940 [Spirochaetaceae bacterium]|jgi:hypothetical protein|nr:hypothetical protein [Spirochaetaceae bacterium]
MELNAIVNEFRADKNQVDFLRNVAQSIGNIVKNNSNYLVRVKKTAHAGSVYKNTLLKNHLEVDCVYILERGYGLPLYGMLMEIENILKWNLPAGTRFKKNTHSISIELERKIGRVNVDVLAAYEVNSPLQMMEVRNHDAYYGSTALFNKKYFNNMTRIYPRFSDLVLLLKLWKDSRSIPLNACMLELIAAEAVSRTREGEDFSFFLEMCFRTMQSFASGGPVEPVYWDEYLDGADIDCSYGQNGLLMIDPADPNENLAKDISTQDINYIKSQASKAACFMRKGEYSFLYS